MQRNLLAYFNAFQREIFRHGAIGQFRTVIVATEMAQADIVQVRRIVIRQEFGGLAVAQMSPSRCDPPFQWIRIAAVLQHIFIVITFDHQMIRFADVVRHFVGDGADIGCQRKFLIAKLEKIARVIGTVVGHIKGRNAKIFDVERLAFFDVPSGPVQTVLYQRTTVDAFVNFSRSIYRNVELFAQVSYGFDVIVMIVRDEKGINGRDIDSAFRKALFDDARAYTGIDENTVTAVTQVITITAATAAKAEKRKSFRRKKVVLHNLQRYGQFAILNFVSA